jgi:signal transduction histidine kinase
VSLYRIIIEFINNTFKHANANKIYITFKKEEDNKLKMIYADNGIGFDLAEIKEKATGIGLLNIQNRVSTLDGELEIKTAQNKGFIASIVLKNIKL